MCGSESYSSLLVIIHLAKMSSAISDNGGKGKHIGPIGFSNLIAAEEGVSRFGRLTLLASYFLRVCYHPSAVGIAVMMIMIMKLLLEAWICLMRSGELSRLCRKQ